MAIIEFFQSTDMQTGSLPLSEENINNATITIATGRHIQAVSGNEVLNIYGRFIYSGAGSAIVNSFNFISSGSKVIEASKLNWNILSSNPNVGEDFFVFRKADIIYGSDFDDVLLAYAGNDTLIGGSGDDELYGGDGTDTASYSTALSGVNVDLNIAGIQDTVSAGQDLLDSIENLTGSEHDDVLIGDSTNNILKGEGGNDILRGGLGDDKLIGGSGSDTASYSDALSGVRVNLGITRAQNTLSSGKDLLIEIENLTGSSHDDSLKGNKLDNILLGGAGNDILSGGLGDDILNGGAGIDIADFSKEKQAVEVDLSILGFQDTGVGQDQFVDIENVLGTRFHDTLIGDSEDNFLRGGRGNDVLDGGSGVDTADYSDSKGKVSVDLSITTAQKTGMLGQDQLTNIENVIGSKFKDVLTGDAGDNSLFGEAGNDTLLGGAGDDILFGGLGNDVINGGLGNNDIYGGQGKDTFIVGDGISNILDFSSVDGDQIQLDGVIFSGLSSTKNSLDESSFKAENVLNFNDVLAGPSILFENSTGDIYFDSNGGTGFDSIYVASVTDGLILQHTDFTLI